MPSFLELTGYSLLGLAFLAPLTWPLLIAAAIAAWLGERQQHKCLIQSRMRLIATAALQSLPALVILHCGVMDTGMVPGGDSYEFWIPIALLAQLPVAVIAFWWCQKVGLFSIAIGLVWAAFSISAAFTVSTWGHPL